MTLIENLEYLQYDAQDQVGDSPLSLGPPSLPPGVPLRVTLRSWSMTRDDPSKVKDEQLRSPEMFSL